METVLLRVVSCRAVHVLKVFQRARHGHVPRMWERDRLNRQLLYTRDRPVLDVFVSVPMITSPPPPPPTLPPLLRPTHPLLLLLTLRFTIVAIQKNTNKLHGSRYP